MYERSIGISSIAFDYSTLFGSFKCCTEDRWLGDWCPHGRLSLIARGYDLFYEREIWRMLEYCISIIAQPNIGRTVGDRMVTKKLLTTSKNARKTTELLKQTNLSNNI
ncbi:uncharacterized protein LOC122568770 [Bombus pyrosoma]|uniref:uncharacterized protein LOC122568770 n=1 Tax=Bombus pyrosoma TaxID=396416 RepID=UPI001CB8A6D2|nr:uncharacterized protein LOC122568770 [Bombus pyrosoma]